MSQGSEAQLIREFREILARDELAEDVTVVHGVSGGIPGRQPGNRGALGGEGSDLKLAGDGNLTAPGAPSVRLDPSETRQLLELVASSLDSMVPRGRRASFPTRPSGSSPSVSAGTRRPRTFSPTRRSGSGSRNASPVAPPRAPGRCARCCSGPGAGGRTP